MSLKATLKTFSSRNIRYLYLGDFGLFLGFWLSFLSIIWLVYHITQSSFSLGLMGFLLNLPILILLPFAGVLADRVDRRKLLIWCSAGLLVTPAILAWAAWTDHVSISLIAIVAPLYGAIYAMMNPAVNAFIKELVDQPDEVHRVTGLISSNTKVAQLSAAALSGLLHLLWSVTAVFSAAFLSHLLSLVGFIKIQYRHRERATKHSHPMRQLIEGVQYSFSFSPFWSVMLVAATGSLAVLAWQWQLPVFAARFQGPPETTLSWFFLYGGIGGILGGIYVSCRRSSTGLMRLASLALLVIAIGLMLFSESIHKYWSYSLIFFIDGAWVVLLSTTSTTLQLIVDEDKRGRVMSFYAMGVFGLMPVTNLGVGALCEYMGMLWGMSLVAMICLVVVVFYVIKLPVYRAKLQRHYQRQLIRPCQRPI
jgi:MFS family permease